MTTSDKTKARYRMKDLVEKTGFRRETIHFYIAEGLLPPPVKKQRNSAWYGEEHLSRLDAIRDLQQRQFLPLKAIKAILNDEQEHSYTGEQRRMLEALKTRFHDQLPQHDERLVEVGPLALRTGVTLEEITEFAEVGAIDLHGSGERARIPEQDAVLIECWGALRELGCSAERGFSPRDFEIFNNVMSILLDQEIKLFTERFSDADSESAWSVVENAVPILNRLFPILHEKRIRQFIEKFGEEERRRIAKGDKR